ncbi:MULTISPECIES: SDR family oxidoreductase [Paraburkholderia]|jgi:3-oxoacyl-[acyl-carrier protein] reductase|uniref:SDR family oxidoreductase n=1 Tax=Paraburkholderia madseniana TaxID=2599607 RepID=A0A6N6W209_9BURK|nr:MULTISPECIES: SDR family oxidoreductase [Paraburkholderia]KAE8753888.1 SDR family oxidoreductase [Paraburkholderia madseniana]MCX4170084.1 SDR family oxidoreductase [Paraburkholderia madseniana]MDQ6458096.1 SDR family oxidoreductase [Paraburkholderia madseniana]
MSAANQSGVAIVTGASRGIGATIARRLVRDGFAVAVNYASSSAEADKLVAELAQAGGKAVAVQGDVSKVEDVRRLFETVEQQLGKIDVVVNNAGILKTVPLAQTTDEVFAQTFAINVGGVFNMLREAATRLNDGGRIINLSSTTLALNLPGYSIYNGTKAAVEAFSRVFAKELRGRRITVNCVAPGPVATDLFLNGKTDEQIAQFSKMPPLERLGQPEDIANAVAFLAGPDGAWVNGQVLRANGGIA